jgi:hypothetical protein
MIDDALGSASRAKRGGATALEVAASGPSVTGLVDAVIEVLHSLGRQATTAAKGASV